MPPSQKLEISITRDFGDCEDCGGYEYDVARVVLDGVEVLSACHDGHLGGGNWSGDTLTLVLWTLAKLGYMVHKDGEPFCAHPYCENRYDKGYREQADVALFEGTPQRLEFCTVQGLIQEYGERYIEGTVRAVVPGLAGGASTLFDVAQGWESEDYTAVCLHILGSLCELTLTEHTEPFKERAHDEVDDSEESSDTESSSRLAP